MNNTAHSGSFKKGDKVRLRINGDEYEFVEYLDAFNSRVKSGSYEAVFGTDNLELVVPVSKTPRTDAVFAAVGENILDHARGLETELDAAKGIVDALEGELAALKTKPLSALEDARNLIYSIMRDEVNVIDECEKWLRYYAPRKLREAYDRGDDTNHCKSMGEMVRHEATVRAEPVDHTEGGKYRMLEPGVDTTQPEDEFEIEPGVWRRCHYPGKPVTGGFKPYRRLVLPHQYRMLGPDEIIEAGDEFLNSLDDWVKSNYVGREQPKGIQYRRRVDYAQKAKDVLQRTFGIKSPFRKIDLDEFVDLIIQAAKQ